MAEVHVDAELGASADEVWKLLSDFRGLVEALGVPVETEGEGIGQTRTVAMGPEPTVERLEECDDDAMRVVYSMLRGPLPITDYLATMQLTRVADGRCRLDWSSTFQPAEGASVDDVSAMVQRIYQGGIAGLQARFGA